MRALRNEIDSTCAGVTIVDVLDFDASAPFLEFERQEIVPLAPHTAFVKVNAASLPAIGDLEEQGFRYCETQLSLSWTLRLLEEPDAAASYRFVNVTTSAQRDAALSLASSIFSHDRYTTDPEFGRVVSAKRYRALLEQSLQREGDLVFVMEDSRNAEVVSFASIRRTGAEARLLIGGVSERFHGSGLGAVHDIKGLNHYYALGIRRLRTAVSAINHPIINLEIGHLGFRVRESAVVLRKRYAAAMKGRS